ncbi:hypothetical protein GALMADRAFT_885132 [Galerina marginata CBS 339.88]|uniref:Uncharacterized protein n=1 Tax=Galerina marginata (strain CBS 339.88) TaxID=685588 RepID=A0A067SRZ8_GALM3|nr:hypothetical protein GALMADRAFT_885132 [Galerina marginata CBS 339.88]
MVQILFVELVHPFSDFLSCVPLVLLGFLISPSTRRVFISPIYGYLVAFRMRVWKKTFWVLHTTYPVEEGLLQS